jgi:hypothetical protein
MESSAHEHYDGHLPAPALCFSDETPRELVRTYPHLLTSVLAFLDPLTLVTKAAPVSKAWYGVATRWVQRRNNQAIRLSC